MTVFLMIIAAVVAALIALFQYSYIGASINTKKKPWFALLRFLTVFCILSLFIAPRFNSKTYESVLPQLVIMVDDSKSIDYLEASSSVQKDLKYLLENDELISKFEIQTFQFSDRVELLDSLHFNKTETDLGKAILEPQELFKNRNKAVVLYSINRHVPLLRVHRARWPYMLSVMTKHVPIRSIRSIRSSLNTCENRTEILSMTLQPPYGANNRISGSLRCGVVDCGLAMADDLKAFIVICVFKLCFCGLGNAVNTFRI